MKNAVSIRPCASDIVRAVTTYSQSAHGGQPISLKAALGDLRSRLPNLKMSDRALASIIAEAAFKEGHEVRLDLKSAGNGRAVRRVSLRRPLTQGS